MLQTYTNLFNFKQQLSILNLVNKKLPLHSKLSTFWLNLKAEYPALSDLTISVLFQIVSTNLCESALLTLTFIKKKYRASINELKLP